jgi:hypothetical protein
MKNVCSNPGRQDKVRLVLPPISWNLFEIDEFSLSVSLPFYAMELEIFSKLCTLFQASLGNIMSQRNTIGFYI